jgi:uncharacterized protein
MRRVVPEQKLGSAATISTVGRPDLEPNGTPAVWEDDHLVFADLASPVTVASLRGRPKCEDNAVDPFVRTGYRFRGTARIIDPGPEWERFLPFFERLGVPRARDPASAPSS